MGRGMVVRGDPEGPSPFPREPLGYHPADPVPTTPSGPRLQLPLPRPTIPWMESQEARAGGAFEKSLSHSLGLRAERQGPTVPQTRGLLPQLPLTAALERLPGPQPPPPHPQAKVRCGALKLPCLLWLTSTTFKACGRGRVDLLRLPSPRPALTAPVPPAQAHCPGSAGVLRAPRSPCPPPCTPNALFLCPLPCPQLSRVTG